MSPASWMTWHRECLVAFGTFVATIAVPLKASGQG